MFAFLKALLIGAVFGFCVSGLVGHSGSTGGITHIRHYVIENFAFYWSWVLFLAGTGLAFVILLMLE